MDKGGIEKAMNDVTDYFSAMSWGSFKISYDILDQYMLPMSSQSPNMYAVKNEAISYANGQNKNYDGVIVIYDTPDGGALKSSIYGTTNEDPAFIWLKHSAVDLGAIRHEMGHNFGHYHHVVNSYEYRETGNYEWNYMEHFDMVSITIEGYDFMYTIQATRY
jgi:hypothetical protein